MWNVLEKHGGLAGLLLLAIIAALVFAYLYEKEKLKTKQIEEGVRSERKFYELLSENGANCYGYFRKGDLKPLFLSRNFETMTGISREIFQADIESVRQLADRKDVRAFSEALKNWDQKSTFSREVDFQILGTQKKRTACILIDKETEEGGYLVELRDITEEKLARDRLEQELGKARRESQEKTDFLSQMSHEIRTPMNGILGMLSLAKSHLSNPEETLGYLEKTENLSQFLLNLINDILDMSRIESGKMELEEVPFDLYALGEKLDSMFRQTAQSKGIHWAVQMQDFKEHYVVGDEMRLSQVIINFISNANKFTPEGGSVTVTFRQMDIIGDSLHFMIRVRDTGKGIRKDFIDKIFRPFEQEDASTAHNYGGSGLGMAIADNMIRLMDGQILVDSEEGRGSEFTVYLSLPIAKEAEKEQLEQKKLEQNVAQSIGREDEEATAREFNWENVRILLAEDNEINAEIAVEILQMQGATVECVADGEEAVRVFAQSQPGTYDLILMDIQMPKMDGWEATRQIRQLERSDSDLPIFAMSANAFLEDQRKSAEAGMDGHINKPVDFEKVRKLAGESLMRRRSKSK